MRKSSERELLRGQFAQTKIYQRAIRKLTPLFSDLTIVPCDFYPSMCHVFNNGARITESRDHLEKD